MKLLVPANDTFAFDDTHSQHGHCRIIGRFRTGVESLFAVPYGPWTRWMRVDETERWIENLNRLEKEGGIEWETASGFPEIREPWRTLFERAEVLALTLIARDMTAEERDAIAAEVHES